MNVNFKSTLSCEGTLVVGIYSDQTLTKSAEDIDHKTGGTLKRALKEDTFQGRRGKIFSIIAPQGIESSRLIVIGLGKK